MTALSPSEVDIRARDLAARHLGRRIVVTTDQACTTGLLDRLDTTGATIDLIRNWGGNLIRPTTLTGTIDLHLGSTIVTADVNDRVVLLD